MFCECNFGLKYLLTLSDVLASLTGILPREKRTMDESALLKW
jgi:hypothetical protein